MRLPILFITALTCASCTTFPELDGRIPAAQTNASFPDLVPLAPLLAQAQTTPRAVPQIAPSRLAGLRARAAALRGPVIGAPLRARMLRALR